MENNNNENQNLKNEQKLIEYKATNKTFQIIIIFALSCLLMFGVIYYMNNTKSKLKVNSKCQFQNHMEMSDTQLI